MSFIYHSGLRSEAIPLRYGNPNPNQTQGSFLNAVWMYWKHQLISPPYSSLTLHLRRELSAKELSLLRTVSLMTSPRKGSTTWYISSVIFILHLSPVLMAFPSCKITGDGYYQLPGIVCQHLLPRTLTYVFFS